jgi:HlyD family secretion protein
MRQSSIAVLALVLAAAACGKGSAAEQSAAASFRLKKGDLKLTLAESGTLEARNKVTIRPQIKTSAKVLAIVDQGTLVKEGDILVELDKAEVDKEIEKLEDSVIQLNAELKNAETDLSIKKGENESDIAKAELTLEFARLELKRYEEGDHPQKRREKKLRIEQSESELAQADEKFKPMPKLREQGFVTPVEMEEKRLALESAKVEVDSAKLDLELFDTYTHPMELKQKQSDVTEAERELTRVKARAEARIESAEAVRLQKKRQYDAALQKLDEAKTERGNHTIVAPQPGIVIYGGQQDWRGGSEDEIKVGATAFPGRTLIELPDLTFMDAKLQVHQADIGKLKPGQKAFITLPGRTAQRYEGRVSEIGSVAGSQNWRDPVRRFDVKVQIADRVEGLRAGVTVEVEVDLGEVRDVLFVPLQAISSSGNSFTVYLKDGGEVRRRRVKLGVANEQYVQVLDGLAEGDEILLVNPEIVAEDEKEEEAAPKGAPAAESPAKAAPSGGAPEGGRPAGARPGGGGNRTGGGGR